MVLGAASLWGTLGYFGKLLYGKGLTPLELASVRAAVGTLGLALWAAPAPARLRIRPRDLPFFALYGVVAVALFQWLYFEAVARTSLANAAALLYTAPAFVVLLARLSGDRHLTRLQLLALSMVLAGVFLVTGAAAALAGGARIGLAALAFGLGSGLTYGLYTVFGKRALQRYDPSRTVFWAFAFGALTLSLGTPPWRPFMERPAAAPLLVLLGLLPTLAAYLLYINALRRLPAPTAAMLATLEPVVATLIGVVLLGEAMGAGQAAGVALIVGAALLLARARPRATATSAQPHPTA
jgi:DME family drug/metabolite transporter